MDKTRSTSPWFVVLLTLVGSLVLSLAGALLGRPDWATGAWVGGVLSVLNYLGLRFLVAKLLGTGNPGGFWAWTLMRYGIAAWVFWRLVIVSVPCLLAALAAYLWSLAALFWTGSHPPSRLKRAG